MLIGTDRSLFVRGSVLGRRIGLLAEQVPGDTVTSIVFSTRAHGCTKPVSVSAHATAYPTNSFSRLLYGWDAYRIARRVARPDIISAQDPFETGLVTYWIARALRVPFTVEIHTDFLTSTYAQHSLLNRLRVIIAGFVISRASGGYAVSQRVRDEVVRHYALKTEFAVLPIYVDVSSFVALPHTPHPRFKTTLLWVGRLEREKRPQLALAALKAARDAGHEVGLIIVGGGQLKEKLEANARKMGIGDWIEFVGVQTDVQRFYAMADLLLVTSAYEGYGMVIVEALSAGVPVLSTNVGVAREAGAIIATDDYSSALLTWLTGPREHGVLTLDSYKNEQEYMTRTHSFYAELLK